VVGVGGDASRATHLLPSARGAPSCPFLTASLRCPSSVIIVCIKGEGYQLPLFRASPTQQGHFRCEDLSFFSSTIHHRTLNFECYHSIML
jgi:hypothetical protein